MNRILLYIVLSLNIFAANSQRTSDVADIKVTAFYSDFVYLYDSLPDKSWTYHPFVQLHIKQTFDNGNHSEAYKFKHDFFINELVPDLMIKNVTIETDSGCYCAAGATELIERINRNDYGMLRQITFSMNPFDGLGIKYAPQAIYVMPDMTQSWFISDDSNKKHTASFNIDGSLFYLRSSKFVDNTNGCQTITFSTDKDEPAFYLFYLPAYRHLAYEEDKRFVDLLAESIDTAQSGRRTIIYKKANAEEDSCLLERLKKTISTLDRYMGRDASPYSLFIVKSNQALYRKMGDVETRAVFSRAHRDNSYSLILLDNSHYNTHTLMHEILHTYIKEYPKDDKNLYEYHFFGESLVEYLSCNFHEETFGDSIFSKKLTSLLKNEQNMRKAKELLKTDASNSISLEDNERNTS